MAEPVDRPIAVKGAVLTIEYATCVNGAMPAKEFIDALDEGDKRKLAVLFRRMADHGNVPNREQFRKVQDQIFEFKKHQLRVFCFRRGTCWFLTNGYRKKKDKLDPAEIERAERIMREHLSRETLQRRNKR